MSNRMQGIFVSNLSDGHPNSSPQDSYLYILTLAIGSGESPLYFIKQNCLQVKPSWKVDNKTFTYCHQRFYIEVWWNCWAVQKSVICNKWINFEWRNGNENLNTWLKQFIHNKRFENSSKVIFKQIIEYSKKKTLNKKKELHNNSSWEFDAFNIPWQPQRSKST